MAEGSHAEACYGNFAHVGLLPFLWVPWLRAQRPAAGDLTWTAAGFWRELLPPLLAVGLGCFAVWPALEPQQALQDLLERWRPFAPRTARWAVVAWTVVGLPAAAHAALAPLQLALAGDGSAVRAAATRAHDPALLDGHTTGPRCCRRNSVH